MKTKSRIFTQVCKAMRFQKSTKWCPGIRFEDFLALATKLYAGGSIWTLSGLGPRSRQNDTREARFDNFLTCAPEVNKMHPGTSIWALPGIGSRSRQNEVQQARFECFLALAPEVDNMSSRRLDFSTFLPWRQKLSKWVPEGTIRAHSGLGSGSRRNKYSSGFHNVTNKWNYTSGLIQYYMHIFTQTFRV